MFINSLQTSRAKRRPAARRGFTLIELGVVILIIGIVVGFIIVASMGATEHARVRATQALIIKLEVGLNERIQAITASGVVVNGAHQFLASVNPQGYQIGQPPLAWGLPSGQRAEVIARFDQLRMEVPDVFFIQITAPGPNDYPINFAGRPYNPTNLNVSTVQLYLLPLGHSLPSGYLPPAGDPPYAEDGTHPNLPYVGPGAGMGIGSETGIYGASYTARAAIHKLIGLHPNGCDGANNNPTQNPFVDEFAECVPNPNDPNDQHTRAWIRFRENHTHNTARAEMLYALLVEGAGPMGSVFGKEEFKEDVDYKDTDNDGLPEFVDGWGRPLQFYRWPIYYPSDGVQGGCAPYGNTFQTRESHPLDPNSQLTAPAWWIDLDGQVPDKSFVFQTQFTSLIDPNIGQLNTDPNGGNYWSRQQPATPGSQRRAFKCKFLIISSGPDQQLGLYRLDDDFVRQTGVSSPDTLAAMLIGNPAPVNAPNDYAPTQFGENWAVMAFEPDEAPSPASLQNYNGYPLQRSLNQQIADYSAQLRTEPPGPPRATMDNIDNHKVRNEGGGVR